MESTVILRGSIFRPGRTYRNYTGHLEKACFLTGHSLDRLTPAVSEISCGLRRAQNNSPRFPNFLYTADLYRVINNLGRLDPFAQLAFPPFLFSLRAPSEALPMRRACDHERLADFVPQNDKVLIGVRPCSGVGCLILKMAWRKNLAGLHP